MMPVSAGLWFCNEILFCSSYRAVDQMLQCKPLIDQQLHQKQKQVLEVLDTVTMC